MCGGEQAARFNCRRAEHSQCWDFTPEDAVTGASCTRPSEADGQKPPVLPALVESGGWQGSGETLNTEAAVRGTRDVWETKSKTTDGFGVAGPMVLGVARGRNGKVQLLNWGDVGSRSCTERTVTHSEPKVSPPTPGRQTGPQGRGWQAGQAAVKSRRAIGRHEPWPRTNGTRTYGGSTTGPTGEWTGGRWSQPQDFSPREGSTLPKPYFPCLKNE